MPIFDKGIKNTRIYRGNLMRTKSYFLGYDSAEYFVSFENNKINSTFFAQ